MSSRTTNRRSNKRVRSVALPAIVVMLIAPACNLADRSAVGGEPVEVRSDEGNSDKLQETKNHEERLAPIVVDAPSTGQTVSSPVIVSGTANVFEATVSMRLLDASGEVILETFTTATCGSGCRGDYSKRVRFEVDEEQEATLEVFESSAEDGRPLHTVSIPLHLAP